MLKKTQEGSSSKTELNYTTQIKQCLKKTSTQPALDAPGPGDLQAMKFLMQNEMDSFCVGDGLNCFILAALTERGSENCKWQLVLDMLEIDLRGITSENEDGSSLLMYFANCPLKIRHLVSLGANLNHVDKAGNSVLMRSYQHRNPDCKAFLELLKLGADPNVPPNCGHDNIIEFMLSSYHCLNLASKEAARKCLSHILQPEYFEKISDLQFKANPIFKFIGELCDGAFGDLHCHSNFWMEFLKTLPRTKLLKHVNSSKYQTDEWIHFKEFWDVPDSFLMDPLSFFYFSVCIFGCSRQRQDDYQCDSPDVLPPGLALMYNVTQRNLSNPFEQRVSRGLILVLLQENIPRLLVNGDKILALMTPFFLGNGPEFNNMILKILRTLPNNPALTFRNGVAKYMAGLDDIGITENTEDAHKLVDNVNQLIEGNLCQADAKLLSYYEVHPKLNEISLDGSWFPVTLQELCRRLIRDQIHCSLKNKGGDLSSSIKNLCEMSYISPPLVKYLLVFQ
ncbi:Hypothetical predicted protein [Cloeon dipterum]|uniref:SOCS box domain-containing protein n=1 Tax=Cloeon dipterum TaxID=197152 RepID=A0A8S1D307_9INSE|nr:Hypothetical predicted protein [Cloeon dipterum]